MIPNAENTRPIWIVSEMQFSGNRWRGLADRGPVEERQECQRCSEHHNAAARMGRRGVPCGTGDEIGEW
jgi:hypothetical protein